MIWKVVAVFLVPAISWSQSVLNVGSKRFTESYILGEIVTQAARAAGEARVVHHQGLGNTGIVFEALKAGTIDIYPEYTGTISFELLHRKSPANMAELNRDLAPFGLGVAIHFGFDNTYALAMREERAARLGIKRISDLIRHPTLRLGLSQEFLSRRDGWPALRRAYGLPLKALRGLDHGLAYEALAKDQIDVMDVYSTDAKIKSYRLQVLVDDRGFFPAYDAVLLYRLDVPERFPASWHALQQLQNSITAKHMIAMNAAAELDHAPFAQVAHDFLSAQPQARTGRRERRSFVDILFGEDLGNLTLQHLLLVFASLALSVLVGIPLGVLATRSRRAGHWILGAVGMLQTIPSLALLAFLITIMGSIGTAPAVVALFLYALLPIVRNTHSGLIDIAWPLRESALALGLPEMARLRLIELPLAARSILSGIKTSAVINVGTATIAAFVGAGGYGDRIVAGLAVNDTAMMLAGAVPAAVLALLIQWTFDVADRRLVPGGLRHGPERDRS